MYQKKCAATLLHCILNEDSHTHSIVPFSHLKPVTDAPAEEKADARCTLWGAEQQYRAPENHAQEFRPLPILSHRLTAREERERERETDPLLTADVDRSERLSFREASSMPIVTDGGGGWLFIIIRCVYTHAPPF